MRAAGGEPLVLVGRRGGVPILWVASNPTGGEGPAMAPDRPRLATVVPPLEAEIAPSLLLTDREAGGRLFRRRPVLRARRRHGTRHGPPRVPGRRQAVGGVRGRGRRPAGPAPRPGASRCAQSADVATAFVEPVAARYRTTLVLNLAAMGLAVLLGVLAVREVARRERLEARAHEEARVRELERQLFHAERLTTVGRLAAGHRPRDQQPAGGDGQLPEPGRAARWSAATSEAARGGSRA